LTNKVILNNFLWHIGGCADFFPLHILKTIYQISQFKVYVNVA